MKDSNNKLLYDYTILGLGAAGLHLAMAMVKSSFFSDKRILLLDKDQKEEDDRTWCFWERGIGSWDSIVTKEWKEVEVAIKGHHFQIDLEEYSYKMLRGKDFYFYCLNSLKQEESCTIVFDKVTGVEENTDKILIRGEKSLYETEYLFTSVADYPPPISHHPYLSQHFGGWFIQTEEKIFLGARPQFMNFDIEQNIRTQFMYMLPYSDNEALFEFTLFSKEVLEKSEYESFLTSYLEDQNIGKYQIIQKEFGNIPMTTFPFWKYNTARKMYIGSAGGWTKPSTGYTFYFCQKYAASLVKFLVHSKSLDQFRMYNRFFWYDKILLTVLEKHNHLGSAIFFNMFLQNNVKKIFRFLNHESELWEEFLIILKTKYPILFFNSFIKTLFKSSRYD